MINKYNISVKHFKSLIFFSIFSIAVVLRIITSVALGFKNDLPGKLFGPLPMVFQSENFFSTKVLKITFVDGTVWSGNLSDPSNWPFKQHRVFANYTAFVLIDRPKQFGEQDWKRLVAEYYCGEKKKNNYIKEFRDKTIQTIELIYTPDPMLNSEQIQRKTSC